MGMFSEMAEEMEEKAYKKGFIHGMIWPISGVIWGIKIVGEKIWYWQAIRHLKRQIRERKPEEPVYTPPPKFPEKGMSFRDLKKAEGIPDKSDDYVRHLLSQEKTVSHYGNSDLDSCFKFFNDDYSYEDVKCFGNSDD